MTEDMRNVRCALESQNLSDQGAHACLMMTRAFFDIAHTIRPYAHEVW